MPLAPGDTGTSQTMGAIRRLVDQGIKDPVVNRTAIQIAWNTPQFSNDTAKAQAVWNFVTANFRFFADMVGKETLRTAREMLQTKGGDCDDFTILIASLLGTIGIRTRARTIASHGDDPQEFSHIYPEAFCDSQWIAMDVARPDAQFGRAPEIIFRDRAWDLFAPTFLDLKGLSGYCCQQGMGRGRLGRGRLGYLGQDGSDESFDVSSIFNPADIAAVTSGTANIIAASRAAPANIVAVSNPSATTLLPGGSNALLGSSSSLLSGSGGSLLLLLGLGIAALLVLKK